jgi:hypothetical protein
MSLHVAHVAPTRGGRYRSLFEDLPPLQVDEEVLHGLGRPGGGCDLGAGVAEDADSHVAAVWPFFGQFVAHDITADRSPLAHHADLAGIASGTTGSTSRTSSARRGARPRGTTSTSSCASSCRASSVRR